MSQATRARPVPLVICVCAGLLCLIAACGRTAPAAKPAAPSHAASAPATSSPASKPAGGSAQAPSNTPVKVTVKMDFLLTGWDAGYWVAADRGYYRKLGLDVTPEQGKGTFQTIEAVANRQATFGQVDGGPLIEAVGRGLPILGVAQLFKASPDAIVVPAASAIHTIADLKGKKVGLNAANSTAQLLPGVLAYNHMSSSAIHPVNMSNNAIVPALLQHRVDAVATFGIGLGAIIQAKGMPIRTLLYDDNGLSQPGYAIATNPAYAKAHPSVVSRFIQGTRQGWDWVRQHPKQAIAIETKSFPQSSKTILLTQLKLSFPFWSSPVGGSFDQAQYAKGQKELLRYHVIKKSAPLDRIVTEAYLPK